MARIFRLTGMALLMLVLVAAPGAKADSEVGIHFVSGDTELATLAPGAHIFANQDCTLDHLPPEMEGMTFTRRNWRSAVDVDLDVPAHTTVYIMLGAAGVAAKVRGQVEALGWTKIGSVEFTPNDRAGLAIYRRDFADATQLRVPGGGFPGDIIVARHLTLRNSAAAANPTPAPSDEAHHADIPPLRADEEQDLTPISGAATKLAKSLSSILSLEVYTTDTGMMLGQTSQVVLTVNRGTESKLTSIRFVTPVGDQMRLARDEALRFIRLTYPNWYADRAEITFEDKYNGHEGGSIGAALGTLILSAIQGFDIDPNLAMTGDISANGRVRAIGGVYAKLRGAVASHCTIVAMPADNFDQIMDTAIYSGWDVATKVQIVGISSLDDAVAVARSDRGINLAAAISDFAQIQQLLQQSPSYLHTQQAQDRLAEVLRLAPQHLSAKLLLMFAQGKQPKTLSPAASEYYTFVAVNTMMPILKERFDADAGGTLTPSVVKDGLADLKKLRPMADESIRPLIDAWSLYIWSISRFEAGDVTADTVEAKRQALLDVMTRLGTDQDLMQKMLKEGM